MDKPWERLRHPPTHLGETPHLSTTVLRTNQAAEVVLNGVDCKKSISRPVPYAYRVHSLLIDLCRTGLSASVISDLVTHPVCGAYGQCSVELFRATVRARDVGRRVPIDGYPSYRSIRGLGWSGTGHRSYSRALRRSRRSHSPLGDPVRKGVNEGRVAKT